MTSSASQPSTLLRTGRVLVATAALTAGVCLTAAPHSAAAAAPRCHGYRATIVGTPRNDHIHGTPGPDVIVARGGADTIDGGGGNDVICSDGGNDVINAGAGNDHAYGGAGNDTVNGGPGRDWVNGDGGNDRLDTGPGSGGSAFGGPGNDTIVLHADASFGFGDAGDDRISSFARHTGLDGGDGNDTLFGSKYADILAGDDGVDFLNGNGGDDTLNGGDGDDTLHGDAGDDVMHGGDGNDVLTTGPSGGAGSKGDESYGDAGDDFLFGDANGSHLYGGPGDDTLEGTAQHLVFDGGDGLNHYTGSKYADTIIGGNGVDLVTANGGDDNISTGPGDDIVFGDAGNDLIDLGDGTDSCFGGDGIDQCNGGAPGTLDNTPADPDICDAEVTLSCKADGPASQWTVHLTGTSTYRPGPGSVETTQWDMTDVLHVENSHGTYVFTDDPSARHGSYSTHGTVAAANGGTCTVDASGTFTESDESVTLRVDTSHGTYGLDWTGLGAIEDTMVCGSEQVPHVTHVGAQEQFDGVALTPDSSGALTGRRTFTNDDNCTEEYSYTLAPVTG
jgi:hypothetical protein